MFPNCPSIIIDKLLRENTTVPNKKAYFHVRTVEGDDEP